MRLEVFYTKNLPTAFANIEVFEKYKLAALTCDIK